MHLPSYLSLLACVFSYAAAVNFTYPVFGDTLLQGSTYNVTWTSVDTDPGQFSIYLWNFLYYPPYYTFLTQVQTNALSQNITIPCNVAAEGGWQFTAINGTNVYVIYAQTGNFTIEDTQCSSPTVGPNPEGSIVTYTSTATVTSTISKARTTITSTITSTSTTAATTTTITATTTATTTTTTTSISTVTKAPKKTPAARDSRRHM